MMTEAAFYVYPPPKSDWVCVKCGVKVKEEVSDITFPGIRWDCLEGTPIVCYRCQFQALTSISVAWREDVAQRLETPSGKSFNPPKPPSSPAQSDP